MLSPVDFPHRRHHHCRHRCDICQDLRCPCVFFLKASGTLSSHLEPDLGSYSVSKGTNFVCYLANILLWLVTIFSHLCVEFTEKRFKMYIDLRQCLLNLRWPCAMNQMLKIRLLPVLSHWSCAVSVNTDMTKVYICALVWLGEGGGGAPWTSFQVLMETSLGIVVVPGVSPWLA